MSFVAVLVSLLLANDRKPEVPTLSPTDVASNILVAYVNDRPNDYTEIVVRHGIPGIGFDESAQALFQSRQKTINSFGAIHDHFPFFASGLPDHIERRLYLVEHDRFCVVWEFVFYKSPAVDQWLLVTLNTNQPIEDFIHLLPVLPSP